MRLDELMKRLDEIRARRRISRTQWARDAGYSRSAVDTYSWGIKEPKITVVQDLAEALGLEIECKIKRKKED